MKLTLTFLSILASLIACTQCNPSVQFAQNPVCSGENLSFTGFNNGACSDAQYWVYSWEYNFGQNLLVDTVYDASDSSFAFMPLDIYDTVIGNLTIQVTAYNVSDVVIGYDQYEHTISAPLYPLTVFYFGPLTVCNQLTELEIYGGVAPYDILSNGVPLFDYSPTPGFYSPSLDSGDYSLQIIDALGCILDTTATYHETITENYTCETAQVLQNGVPYYYQGLCTFEPVENVNCASAGVFDGGWFSFQAGGFNNAAITFIPDSLFGEYITYGEYCFEIFESLDGTCANMNSVYCGCAPGGQINLGEFFSLEPTATYYLLLMTSADFSYIVVDLANEFVANAGCSEINSCNYNPEPHDYEVCLYPGCMDQLACNYDALAICEDGSCTYPSNISAQAFFDEDADGYWDAYSSSPEGGWSGSGYFTLVETGQIIYPDMNGALSIADVPAGTYTLSFTDPNGYWQVDGNQVDISIPSCDLIEIAIESTNASYDQYSVLNVSVISTFLCETGTTPVVSVLNTGSMPLNAVLTFSFNGPFVLEANSFAIPFDDSTDSTATWFIENQDPGSVVNYGLNVQGLDSDHVGEIYEFVFHIDFYFVDGTIWDSQEWTVETIVTCSYDPNVKQAIPIGYRDEHFILAGNEIEYTIQFQNTGNDFAHDIVIVDSLDLTKFDLNTFLPVQGSHPFSTIVNDLGIVHFQFDNIQLPGVAMSDPLSHGFVTFKIQTRNDLLPDETVDNQASIYFDSNDPIVTNTYQHTIFSCDWLPQLPDLLNSCEGDFTTPTLDETYVDLFEWSVDGVFAGNESTITEDFASGVHEISLIVSNPLCQVSSVLEVNVADVPSAQIDWNDQTECIVASPGESYQWYFGSTLIKGQTEQTLCLGEDFTQIGTYYCVVTNVEGCSTQSYLFLYFSVENIDSHLGAFYPNPLVSRSSLVLPDDVRQISIHDVSGKLVRTWIPTSKIQELDRVDFAAGLYNITMTHKDGLEFTIIMIVE